jgi:hypothetical protein
LVRFLNQAPCLAEIPAVHCTAPTIYFVATINEIVQSVVAAIRVACGRTPKAAYPHRF